MKTATERKILFSVGSVCRERLLRSWFFLLCPALYTV